MGDYLRYEQGLSKYAVVSLLFPRDSYTHRMKRLQRAAHQGVWAKHFDLIPTHGAGLYPVQRLAPRNPRVISYLNGKARVHIDSVRCAYADLLFPHEKQQARRTTSLMRLWTVLKDLFWYF
jgi:hypothetical protein